IFYNQHIPIVKAWQANRQCISLLFPRKFHGCTGSDIRRRHPYLTHRFAYRNPQGHIGHGIRFALRTVAVPPFHGTGIVEVDKMNNITVTEPTPVTRYISLYSRTIRDRYTLTLPFDSRFKYLSTIAQQILVAYHKIVVSDQLIFG